MKLAADIPLRPYGSDWAGVNTRRGRLARGSEMDSCVNVIINQGDTLSKRQGFIRAIDKQFSGPVCGLFPYTDDCGVERLLVADQEQISVETPFNIPVAQVSDAFPSDEFTTLTDRFWRNISQYASNGSQLVRTVVENRTQKLPARAIRWFKQASRPGYSLQSQYLNLSAGSVYLFIRADTPVFNDYIVARLTTTELQIIHGTGESERVLQRADVSGLGGGFLAVSYNALNDTVTASVTETAGGANIVSLSSSSTDLTALQVQQLGLYSGVGIEGTAAQIENITGF